MEPTTKARPRLADLQTGRTIVLPGLLMLVSQARAVLSFGTPGGMSGRDVLAIISALCFTGFFGVSWNGWRDRRRLHGPSRGGTWWPLVGFALLPLAFAGAFLYQWIDGPSPFSTLKESALTGCNLPGDEWRSATGRVGLIEAPSGEVIFVYNVQNDHGDAVIRTRTTRDVDYEWYASLVVNGRSPRAERVLCFEQRSPRTAVLRDITTGAQAGDRDETDALITLANS